MKCKVCGAESGKYPLCRGCNNKKERGEIIKCANCGMWHYAAQPCPPATPVPDRAAFLYEAKTCLISKCEQDFYAAIQASLPEGFCVFPQINLATFITRTDDARFHNELFRNVDFLITDKAYQPKFVIEINDQTHLNAERRERDEKVQKICEEAGIPIVKLWTSYGINPAYIQGKIIETLNTLPVARVHHFAQSPAPAQQPPVIPAVQPVVPKKKGCYIATCVYGSYDCAPVWVLRRYRDSQLSTSWYGRAFIKTYYAISPTLVTLFGNRPWFQSLCRRFLDGMVQKLRTKGVENTPYQDTP
ncbi:MAG: DUF2726 domain-containing protein [Clostridia bacterium]|nr:DUF2726 domain-containing protein [Clostridia bacterium]